MMGGCGEMTGMERRKEEGKKVEGRGISEALDLGDKELLLVLQKWGGGRGSQLLEAGRAWGFERKHVL